MRIGSQERGYQRYQQKDLPSERWIDEHLRGRRIEAYDPRIPYLLGDEFPTILQWAVGRDWMMLPAHEWPRRIRQKIGLDIRPEAEIRVGLSLIREAWDRYKRTGRLPEGGRRWR